MKIKKLSLHTAGETDLVFVFMIEITINKLVEVNSFPIKEHYIIVNKLNGHDHSLT